MSKKPPNLDEALARAKAKHAKAEEMLAQAKEEVRTVLTQMAAQYGLTITPPASQSPPAVPKPQKKKTKAAKPLVPRAFATPSPKPAMPTARTPVSVEVQDAIREVVELVRDKGEMTRDEIAARLGKDKMTVYSRLQTAVGKKLLKTERRQNAQNYWVLYYSKGTAELAPKKKPIPVPLAT